MKFVDDDDDDLPWVDSICSLLSRRSGVTDPSLIVS